MPYHAMPRPLGAKSTDVGAASAAIANTTPACAGDVTTTTTTACITHGHPCPRHGLYHASPAHPLFAQHPTGPHAPSPDPFPPHPHLQADATPGAADNPSTDPGSAHSHVCTTNYAHSSGSSARTSLHAGPSQPEHTQASAATARMPPPPKPMLQDGACSRPGTDCQPCAGCGGASCQCAAAAFHSPQGLTGTSCQCGAAAFHSPQGPSGSQLNACLTPQESGSTPFQESTNRNHTVGATVSLPASTGCSQSEGVDNLHASDAGHHSASAMCGQHDSHCSGQSGVVQPPMQCACVRASACLRACAILHSQPLKTWGASN